MSADDLCQCPTCGRMHMPLGAGKPPTAIAGPSLLRPAEQLKGAPPLGLTAEEMREDFGTKLAAAMIAAKDAMRELRNRISTRLNNRLCEMQEGMDDSVVGFNEAWDIVRAAFDEALNTSSQT